MKTIKIILLLFVYQSFAKKTPLFKQKCTYDLQFKITDFVLINQGQNIIKFSIKATEKLFYKKKKNNQVVMVSENKGNINYSEAPSKLKRIKLKEDKVNHNAFTIQMKFDNLLAKTETQIQEKILYENFETLGQNYLKSFKFENVPCDLKLPGIEIVDLDQDILDFEINTGFCGLGATVKRFEIDYVLTMNLSNAKIHLNYNDDKFRRYIHKNEKIFKKFRKFGKMKNFKKTLIGFQIIYI